MNIKKHLKRTVELSKQSLDNGEFPAGVIVVTKSGNIYESGDSFGWNHGELQAIDKAIKEEGAPLDGAIMYASMQSCIMCSAKEYWAGIRKVYYIIPKESVNSEFCYCGTHKISDVTDKFHSKIEFIQDDTYLDGALELYKQWEDMILNK